MNLKELILKMQGKLAEARKAEDPEERARIMDEFDALKKQKEMLERIEAAEKALVLNNAQANPLPQGEEKKDSTKAFATAARQHFKALNEGTPSAGGYTVPEDIRTRIEELRVAKFSLEQLVSVENVKTNTGARTFKNRASQTGFTSVDEGGKIPLKDTPTFSRLVYNIAKYAGVFPVTDELLEDSDENIVNILSQWIADESRVTRNKLVLVGLNEKYTRTESPETAVAVSSLDDIKQLVNVTLGQAFAPTSRIVTNDYGLNYLDTLKNDDGDYLLKRANNDPLDIRVACGSLLIPLTVIPKEDLPNEDEDGSTKIPLYVGDLKEGICLFDRKRLTIKASDTAYMGNTAASGQADNSLNAFQEDLTLFRAIERLDVEVRDAAAFHKALVTRAAG